MFAWRRSWRSCSATGRIRAAKRSGGPGSGGTPSFVGHSRIAGAPMISRIVALSRAMMGAGVPAGAKTARPSVSSAPGTTSLAVAIPGRTGSVPRSPSPPGAPYRHRCRAGRRAAWRHGVQVRGAVRVRGSATLRPGHHDLARPQRPVVDQRVHDVVEVVLRHAPAGLWAGWLVSDMGRAPGLVAAAGVGRASR
jgi:hypothetical protein